MEDMTTAFANSFDCQNLAIKILDSLREKNLSYGQVIALLDYTKEILQDYATL